MPLRAELRFSKPTRRKFVAAVCHISASKNAKLEHLLRRQLGVEVGMKVPADRLRDKIGIILLHLIVDLDPTLFHGYSQLSLFELIQRLSP